MYKIVHVCNYFELLMAFRFVKKFGQFKDLFAADPLLLPMFYYLCPRQELPELFNNSTEHPHLSIAWLAELMKKSITKEFFYKEVRKCTYM